MASCQTAQWGNQSPYVKLTVTETASNGGSATLSWTLQYIAPYAASSNVAKSYSVTLAGATVKTGTFSIGGKKGTHTIASGTKVINKTTATQSIAFGLSFGFNLTWSDIYKGTLSASSSISVAAKASYTISYNANGGSGAPANQTKWYGTAVNLSSTIPARTGHTFKGWATSASGSVVYASGASYTANAGVTLYAVWQANTYSVTYNANGGSGAPSAQTKTYGKTLTLSTVKPTRDNYNFMGWATSASGSVVNQPGGTYTGNAAITYYAVWELAYTKPAIYNFSVSRCNSAGTAADEGTHALVKFNWNTTNTVTAVVIEWTSAAGDTGSKTVAASGKNGAVSEIIGGALNTELTYTIIARVSDGTGADKTQESKLTLNGSQLPIDFKAGGKGVSVGKTAELDETDSLGGEGVFEVAFDAKFNEPVYGNVLGLNRLPAIPAGAELNDYIQTGAWAIHSNAIAATITCGGVKLGSDDSVPPARAGRFEVSSATGEGIRLEQWSYLRQRFLPYNDANPIFERDVARGEDNVWRFYDWWESSLTPILASKLYNKSAITIALSANQTLSAASAYTEINLNKTVFSMGTKLTRSGGAVLIGENVDYVKVNLQALLKAGTTNGNRHIRIQKISNGVVSNIGWTCVYAWTNGNALYTITPIIAPVKEGDLIFAVYYTGDTTDYFASGSAANGYQTYLTVEEI